MDEWFTVERIDGDTFPISEYRHWEETHSYLLLGTARALLVDTGLGVADIRQVTDALSPLPVTVANTHAHWDHIGGNRYFDEMKNGTLRDGSGIFDFGAFQLHI